jgi:hypothetical protein
VNLETSSLSGWVGVTAAEARSRNRAVVIAGTLDAYSAMQANQEVMRDMVMGRTRS